MNIFDSFRGRAVREYATHRPQVCENDVNFLFANHFPKFILEFCNIKTCCRTDK